MTAVPVPDGPPAALEIDYPERDLDRITTFFRPLTFIPIAIILALVSGPTTIGGPARETVDPDRVVILMVGAGGVLFVPTALMLVFRRKYPGWWFDWNLELTRFSTRCLAYLALLRDEYPSTDEEQAVHLDLRYPDAETELSRYLPLVKWFLAIPHYIALAFLGLAAALCVVVAWFAILFTGRYPRPLFDFVVGVFRWALRVGAYAFLLITDSYPPFRLRGGGGGDWGEYR
ncbi:MAG TPA: DUF4389 domain-containing protein [Gemmatimonadales bacterium]